MQMIATVALGYLGSVMCLISAIELWHYVRRRTQLPPHNAEVAARVTETLADGLAEADFEKSERRGKLYTSAQKEAHRNMLRGRMRLAIDKYVAACKGGISQ